MCSALPTPTLPTGNPWQATLNLQKALIWGSSIFKDYIELVILYLAFSTLQKQSPVKYITHQKEQNVKNFYFLMTLFLTYPNFTPRPNFVIDGLLRNVVLSVPSPFHLLLPFFYSFKSPVNHMINFQTKAGWCEWKKSNWNTIAPLLFLTFFCVHLNVIWISDMVFDLTFIFLQHICATSLPKLGCYLFLPFWT